MARSFGAGPFTADDECWKSYNFQRLPGSDPACDIKHEEIDRLSPNTVPMSALGQKRTFSDVWLTRQKEQAAFLNRPQRVFYALTPKGAAELNRAIGA
jgi:hypothetical protein